jgi:3-dehydroquinate synthase
MTDTHTLRVDLGERSYDIHIGGGLLPRAASLVPMSLTGRRIFVLSDVNVRVHADLLISGLGREPAHIHHMEIEGGESAKSYARLQDVLAWMLSHRVDRGSVLFVVGGGVVGDLGGFAASVVLRGISFVQVPTTLLSQVDSSVGGKTGINAPEGKNLIGSFYQPVAVLCDTDTLKTLPARELKAGYAEVVKYGLIDQPDFFAWLEQHGADVLNLKPAAVTRAIQVSCRAKANIVARDEKETGDRALLNLGHTFGHALEALAGYDGRLLHGEAVSVGMLMAFDLSVRMGICPAADLKRLLTHLETAGMKTRVLDILAVSPEDVVAKMAHDKKNVSGVLTFILARGIGRSFRCADVRRDDVLQTVSACL